MATTTLTPTADTHVISGAGQQGSATLLVCGQIVILLNPLNANILMRFDLSDYEGQDIHSATLNLVLEQASFPDMPHEVTVHELTRAWVESQATWLLASTGVSWTTAGGDYDPTAVATAEVTHQAASLAIDMTDDVRNNRGQVINRLIKLPDGVGHNDHYMTVHSKEHGTSSSWPQLVIVATAPADGAPLEWVSLGTPLHYTAEAEELPPLEWSSRHNRLQWTGA